MISAGWGDFVMRILLTMKEGSEELAWDRVNGFAVGLSRTRWDRAQASGVNLPGADGFQQAVFRWGSGCAKAVNKWRKDCCSSLFIRYNARMAVTRRQKEVLDFLEAFVSRNGYSPSFEEIARGMSLKSLATVHKHITNLEKKGMLDRVHNRSRSIDVLPPGTKTRSSLKLPLAGRIAAGSPVEAVEASETISLADVVGNRDVFALEVRGDSMRDEHIINGDYVLVERTKSARQGEIVVALVHGSETTLKRFYPEGNQVRLQPANLEMEPIYVPAAQVAIQGRVLGVLRKYR